MVAIVKTQNKAVQSLINKIIDTPELPVKPTGDGSWWHQGYQTVCENAARRLFEHGGVLSTTPHSLKRGDAATPHVWTVEGL